MEPIFNSITARFLIQAAEKVGIPLVKKTFGAALFTSVHDIEYVENELLRVIDRIEKQFDNHPGISKFLTSPVNGTSPPVIQLIFSTISGEPLDTEAAEENLSKMLSQTERDKGFIEVSRRTGFGTESTGVPERYSPSDIIRFMVDQLRSTLRPERIKPVVSATVEKLSGARDTIDFVRQYENSEKRIGNETINIDESLVVFAEYYVERIQEIISNFTINGIDSFVKIEPVQHKLDSAYCPLSVAENLFSTGWRDELNSVIETLPRVILRGPAGSGKTTSLHWIVSQFPTPLPNGKPRNELTPFPIFIALRRLNKKSISDWSLGNLFFESLESSELTHAMPPLWFQKFIKSEYPTVIMLDGVDELPARQRDPLWKAIRSFCVTNPNVRIVVTSRNIADTHLSSGGYRNADENSVTLNAIHIGILQKGSLNFLSPL